MMRGGSQRPRDPATSAADPAAASSAAAGSTAAATGSPAASAGTRSAPQAPAGGMGSLSEKAIKLKKEYDKLVERFQKSEEENPDDPAKAGERFRTFVKKELKLTSKASELWESFSQLITNPLMALVMALAAGAAAGKRAWNVRSTVKSYGAWHKDDEARKLTVQVLGQVEGAVDNLTARMQAARSRQVQAFGGTPVSPAGAALPHVPAAAAGDAGAGHGSTGPRPGASPGIELQVFGRHGAPAAAAGGEPTPSGGPRAG